MRRAAKIDDNHLAIVRVLKSVPGISVHSTAALGKGFPDVVCGRQRKNYMFEIKVSEKKRLTPDEADFARDWRGQCDVITSAEEALRIMGINI